MGLYKNKDGVWGIDYRYPPGRNGRRIREPIGTKEEAQIILGERKKAIRLGMNPELQKIQPVPFSEIADLFLEKHAKLKTDYHTYKIRTDALKEHFKGCCLQEIRSRQVEEFIDARLLTGITKSTANRDRSMLSCIFSFAIRRERFFGENPVRKVKKLDEPDGRDRFLTPKEAKALVSNAATHLKPLIIAGLNTGGRLGELLKLRWEYVNLAGGVIRFEKTTTKGKKTRNLPITPELDRVLRERAELRFKGGDAREYVFTFRGKRIQGVRTSFTKAREDAGLGKDVGFHTLRHTFASWFRQSGGDAFRLQQYLGHSTIALTERYSHCAPDYLQDGVAFIGPPKESGGRGVDENVKSGSHAETPSA